MNDKPEPPRSSPKPPNFSFGRDNETVAVSLEKEETEAKINSVEDIPEREEVEAKISSIEDIPEDEFPDDDFNELTTPVNRQNPPTQQYLASESTPPHAYPIQQQYPPQYQQRQSQQGYPPHPPHPPQQYPPQYQQSYPPQYQQSYPPQYQQGYPPQQYPPQYQQYPPQYQSVQIINQQNGIGTEGHSFLLHLCFGWILFWIPSLYYLVSPKHHYHL